METIDVYNDDKTDEFDRFDILSIDEQKMLLVNTNNIKLAIGEILTELSNKVHLYTNLYWQHIYIDRFCNIVTLLTSLSVGVIVAIEIIDDHHNVIFIVLFCLVALNIICNTSRLFIKIRDKCVSYNSLIKMYGQVLTDSKKVLANPMNNDEFCISYENIITKINIVDQYASSYRFM